MALRAARRGRRRSRPTPRGSLQRPMLKLRRATVLEADAPARRRAGEQQPDGRALAGGGAERRRAPAIADTALVGRCRGRRRGDRQRRGARPRPRLGRLRHRPRQPHARPATARAPPGADVMKLNYTSLQHTVTPGRGRRELGCRSSGPSRCSPCTGSSPPSPGRSRRQRARARAWATCRPRAARCPAGTRGRSPSCASAGLLAGHITAGAAFGGERRRSRPPARCTTGCASSAGTPPSAGRARGSSAPGRALGHGGMAALDSRPRRARARLPDAARRADVLGRQPRAPPRHLPPHADRARPAAGARHRRAARGDALARRRRAAGRPRRGLRRALPGTGPRPRSTSSARRGSPATTGAAPPSTCPPSPPAACPPRRWGAASPRIRCSSARRSPAARRSASWPREAGAGRGVQGRRAGGRAAP